MSEILIWLEANETILSAVAAAVVVFSIVGAATRGALKKTSVAVVETARSTRDVLSRARAPAVDVSQPVPGFGGRPAIAVLPFDNMSGDPEQDYFADGITEDILTSLQSFRTFPVIARNSTFAYKGKAMDLREVAKELGAGYILEGSVRRSGDKIRITGQLIDADGRHIWADRYDRDLSDIFAIQDEITSKIVGAIAPEMDGADTRRAHRKPTENLDAWDCALRALSLGNESSSESLRAGYDLAEKAVDMDPQFAQAHALLGAMTFSNFARFDGKALGLDPEQSLDKIAEHASKALSIDGSVPWAHGMLGTVHAFRGKIELGLKETREAVRLNPSDPLMRLILAVALTIAADFDSALEQLEVGKRLSPGDPAISRLVTQEVVCLFALGRYEEAEMRAHEAIAARPRHPMPRFMLVAILDALGRGDEPLSAYQELSRLAPQASPKFILRLLAGQPETSQQFRDALGRAGWED